MRVVKNNRARVNELRDFFVKELSSEPSVMDVVKEARTDDGTVVRVNCEIVDEMIDIVVSAWNDKHGVDLGIREYVIDLFPNTDKVAIKLPNETIGLAIVESLVNNGITFTEFGNGYSFDWIINDNETKTSKIWFSNNFKYFSITTKILQQQEPTISSEYLLDKLGL